MSATDAGDAGDRGEAGRSGGTGGYDAGQRRELEQALRSGGELLCPVCGATLTRQRVDPVGAVSYVRRRVLVICPACRRSAGLDERR